MTQQESLFAFATEEDKEKIVEEPALPHTTWEGDREEPGVGTTRTPGSERARAKSVVNCAKLVLLRPT